jgi:CheY-like chemotaxis protein
MVAYKDCRILVVEDETWVAIDLEAILTDLGCVVIGPAATIREAARLMAAHPVDAALLDLNVNGSMSYEVADALAEARIPFLILTGHERDYLPERYRANGFLQKPYSANDLIRELANLMGDRSHCAEVLRSAGTDNAQSCVR